MKERKKETKRKNERKEKRNKKKERKKERKKKRKNEENILPTQGNELKVIMQVLLGNKSFFVIQEKIENKNLKKRVKVKKKKEKRWKSFAYIRKRIKSQHTSNDGKRIF